MTLGLALLLAWPAQAQEAQKKLPIDLKAGPLSTALEELAAQSGTGLLFPPEIADGKRSPPISGRFTLDEALTRLLEGTSLSFRRTGTGAVILYTSPLETGGDEPAYPEILVIGKQTQNADIRRTENDVQAYQVATAHDLATSNIDNLDQFLRKRLASNASIEGPAQNPVSTYGGNRSQIDLHGLGADQTLVLIDGVRLPGIPLEILALEQPDLNGVPLLAIDRIETLTGTAGGIYGPGAIGGVINVVLKRDFRGADFSLTQGISGQGDARQSRLEGRLGFTPDGDRTDVMIAFGRSTTDGLRYGDRDLAQHAQAIEIARDPQRYVTYFNSINGIIVQSLFGDNLALKSGPEGTDLGSSFTYLPIDRRGPGYDAAEMLAANAGKLPAELSPDGNGSTRSLTGDTKITSIVANVRHRFGDNLEAFVDLIGYENEGKVTLGPLDSLLQVILDRADGSPFREPILVNLPFPGFDTAGTNRLRTVRLSGGLITTLPFHWRGEANYSAGWVRNTAITKGYKLNQNFGLAIGYTEPGLGGEPAPNPFGDWGTFLNTLEAYRIANDSYYERGNNLQEMSLRLAGPLFTRKAGTVTISLLADRRREDVSQSTDIIATGFPVTSLVPQFRLTTTSFYGEMRVPIVSGDAAFPVLRGLELQLAARYDSSETEAPSTEDLIEQPGIATRKTAVGYTFGLRFFPLKHVLFRASIATGELPPTPAQMLTHETSYNMGDLASYPYDWFDSKRGDTRLTQDGPLTISDRGSSRLKPERARSMSVGVVVNPEGATGPRLSIDYIHIEKTNEISNFNNGIASYFLANEDRFPDRVVRAPLTQQDIALGYTGGVITAIDTTSFNFGRTLVDVVDFQIDHEFGLGATGRLRLYGAVTWQPRLSRRVAPDLAAINYVGFDDGALRWRGNGGVDWSSGPWSVNINGQYNDSYHATSAATLETSPPGDLKAAGIHIPPQVYVDLSAGYAFNLVGRGPLRRVGVRFDVANIFDHSPPIVTDGNLPYSAIGDPRGRRFALTLTGRF